MFLLLKHHLFNICCPSITIWEHTFSHSHVGHKSEALTLTASLKVVGLTLIVPSLSSCSVWQTGLSPIILWALSLILNFPCEQTCSRYSFVDCNLKFQWEDLFLTISPGLKSKSPYLESFLLEEKNCASKALGLSSARMLILDRILWEDK